MTEKNSNQCLTEKVRNYFTGTDLGIIFALGIVAFITGRYGLAYILPGGTAPSFVHGFLKLPGPGAGIFIGSAFICVWFVLGLLLVKKPGAAIGVGIVTYLLMLAGSLILGTGRLDWLVVMVAIIIEIFGLLALEKKPWSYIFPVFIGLMGLITLILMATGNAKMGENGAAATVFPLGYAVTGILALCICALCYMYPMKYVFGAGAAEMFYITFCWLFNGKSGFATWVPVTPAIPVLLTFALVCGSTMALIAYGGYHLWMSYNKVPAIDTDPN
ncbi:MAG: hypothetical protein PHP13_03725 [Methanomicrobium sp.]|nr:hypothetical protein [Methanomicrobium sp.]MDD4299985.1 hypothetical protein [Methanomicrobium sp.]